MAVNYLLYTALALEPIFNDLSNLAAAEKREKKSRRRMMGHVPPCCKIHGDHEDRETTSATMERTETKRRLEMDQKNLSENHLIFQVPAT